MSLLPPAAPAPGRTFPLWIPVGAVVLALLYVPTLQTRFDFIDDGNLVYPEPSQPLGGRLAVAWAKVVANYEDLGPFRPTLWAHWELLAELCDGSESAWRAVRLGWCALAALMLLWLLSECGLGAGAALGAAALAMWNPYRSGEIWTSLTLAEGVAMPYALLALVAARRAARSGRPGGWDILGAGCVLMALGCKNTFIALIPAQLFLRISPDGLGLRHGLRRHGWRAALLGLTAIAPVAHFIYFKLNWHPGQYTTDVPSLAQLGRYVSGLGGAVGMDFVGAGLTLTAAAVCLGRGACVSRELPAESVLPRTGRYRAALGAGGLLVVSGIAVYLPMNAMSPRYSMPAAWGLDLLIGVLLSELFRLGWTPMKRLAVTGLAAGLAAVVAANIGKQEKFAARARLLWNMLEWVEQHAPPGATIAWVSGERLNREEGVHFGWHLRAHGRADVRVTFLDGPPGHASAPGTSAEQTLRIVGLPPSAIVEGAERFAASYHLGRRQYVCSVSWGPLPIP